MKYSLGAGLLHAVGRTDGQRDGRDETFRNFSNACEIFSITTEHTCMRRSKVGMSAIFLMRLPSGINRIDTKDGVCSFMGLRLKVCGTF